jgi:predicted N-acyltransferase
MGDSEQATVHTVDVVQDIGDVAATDWEGCAGTDNPFVSHEFLRALEQSGSASAEQGWAPHHLVAKAADGSVLGVAPSYLKSHSYGEYVFDHGWADAFERAGGTYYPKLQLAVPFTPVTGPRLCVRQDVEFEATARALLAGGIDAVQRLGISSLHATFCTEAEAELMDAQGLLLRTGEQFHWLNDGYQSFGDFLGALVSRKRKAIARERRQALADGDVTIETLTGAALTETHWDAFFAFYMDTGRRNWGTPYLNREFFSLLGQAMADQVVLVMAYKSGVAIAGALNLAGSTCLYGRYWGCAEYVPALHFEVCYYRAIDYAIEHRLDRVEAGAQGPHKISRGYLPVRTYSAHWIADPAFRDGVAAYLDQERDQVDDEIGALAAQSPFRKGG